MESDSPCDRPPLTKGLWKDKSIDSIWRSAAKQQAELHLGRTVKSIDLKQKRVSDDKGNTYGFEKLLLATGGEPRLLPFSSDKIIYYRTVGDYRRLRALTEKGKLTLRRHRRRIRRLGNCRGTGDERQAGHDSFSRPEHRNPHLSAFTV